MEWWQSGLSALVGVLVGGLFTYLGLRKQLKHQKEINELEWRRKVRSEPLLKLREELARVTIKASRLTEAAFRQRTHKDKTTQEKLEKQLQDANENWNVYWASESLSMVLRQQYDTELISRTEEIIQDYQLSYSVAEHPEKFGEKRFSNAADVFERNKARVIEIQGLINKKLEEL